LYLGFALVASGLGRCLKYHSRAWAFDPAAVGEKPHAEAPRPGYKVVRDTGTGDLFETGPVCGWAVHYISLIRGAPQDEA